MMIASLEIRIHIGHAQSLKEKRACAKSLIERLRKKFNISVAEVSENDNHKILVIGIACVSSQKNHLESVMDKIINYIEINIEGEIIDIHREVL